MTETPNDLPRLPSGYTAGEVLGHRGDVWVLRAEREGAPLVLRLDTSPDAREGLAELAVLSAVQHPGIAGLVDHGALPGGGRYLARAWVEGHDLGRWAALPGTSEDDIGRMLARLTPALDHLHRQGFIHADLKPENVIVTPEGRPVLCDFGLARASEGGRKTEGVSGSFFFLSPEELLGLEITPMADLFALGAMLHLLIVGPRRSPREFYARFPNSSFLDALGTDPEDLPSWSRDLIVGLTARDPGRRPRTAGAVGRQLADRLTVEMDREEFAEELRWPISLGRDAWVAEWMNSLEVDGEERTRLRVPKDEEPRAFWNHLRLYSSLRGRTVRGVDLKAELTGITDGVAMDQWASAVVEEGADWIAVLAEDADPWHERALMALDRSARLVRRRAGVTRPVLFAVCAYELGSDDAPDDAVPPVELVWIQGFLTRHFPREEPERRREFARRLSEATHGSATLLDGALTACTRTGWILDEDGGGHRLRPGDLPDLTAMLAGGQETATASLADHELEVLRALEVCGGRTTAEDLTPLLEDATNIGKTLIGLRTEEWISVRQRRGQVFVQRRRALVAADEAHTVLRTMHGRRADWLEREGRSPARIAMHRYLSDPTGEHALRLVEGLSLLHSRGRAEEALEITDRCKEAALALGMNLAASAPEVFVERARAWCSLGQTELALREVESQDWQESPRVQALIELARAQVASLRHETDAALKLYDRAIELDDSARVKATVGRIQLLHSLGKDEEVCALVQELQPEAMEERGELPPRERIFVRSMEAMSAMRLGRAQEARSATEGLIREAVELEDSGLEAALHINLAIIERLSGSLARAREEFEQAILLYDKAGLIAGLAHARATLGGLLRELGELVDAEPLLVSAMEMRERLNDPEGSGTARGMLGLLYFERGHARAAIETLESTAESMSGAQKRRYAPLLLTKSIEMRDRLGDTSHNAKLPSDTEGVDPRILLSRARVAWMTGETPEAAALAERARSLSESLKQERLAHEAEQLGQRIRGEASQPSAPSASESETLSSLDARIFELLPADRWDERKVEELASSLGRRGRDDRAARLWLALSARTADVEQAKAFNDKAEVHLDLCTRGLTDEEAQTFRTFLLGEPDAWRGDLTVRSEAPESDEGFEMEVVRLLDINKQLVQQQDLESLLGVIVEHALAVTGAERGFLVLEEHGELRFDTALDSCRGDIAQPEFEISGSVIREALDRGEPIRVSNAVDDPSLGHQTSVVSLELRSILCVPIFVSENLRGAIYVDHRLRKGAFDDRSEKLCTLLANQAAIAIQQIKRLEEIRELNRELERRVVEKEADLRNARRALREAGAVEPGRLIGKSPAMRAVQDLVVKAAQSDISVLIIGESGTGKEVAARALHEESPRSRNSFVSENCAALPASLIESELFGYRKGAFTGADRNRAGLFEQANAGTLFLDEIGELPLDLQAKFLRVLETGEVRRLGDEEARKVDFRLIVATNRNLEREVNEGRFRQDLYYRLEGLRILMPPLADRTEDIEQLVDHFLRQQEARSGTRRKISKKVLTALARRPWPGNVRELRNEVARMCVLSDGDLDDPSLVSRPASIATEVEEPSVVPISELERRAIQNALEQTGGDKRRAAELLGISRAKIYQRLKEWKDRQSE